MRSVAALLAAAIALSLTGCILRGKQPTAKAVPPPPKAISEPAPPQPPRNLSIPQTNVELPPPQPVNMDALNQPPQEEPPPTTVAPARARPRPAAPRPEAATQGPVPPAVQPAEPDRGPIQEIVPAEDTRRYQEETNARKKEIQMRLDEANKRHLSRAERQRAELINSFLKNSDAAAARGDWRSAAELADRGLVLARELTGGR
jgi:hypothetical protein